MVALEWLSIQSILDISIVGRRTKSFELGRRKNDLASNQWLQLSGCCEMCYVVDIIDAYYKIDYFLSLKDLHCVIL
jgi:hypothetical protein